MTGFDGYTLSERIVFTLNPDEFPPSPGGWTYKCINIYKRLLSTSFAEEADRFASNQIFFALHPTDFWIDEVSVRQGEIKGT